MYVAITSVLFYANYIKNILILKLACSPSDFILATHVTDSISKHTRIKIYSSL